MQFGDFFSSGFFLLGAFCSEFIRVVLQKYYFTSKKFLYLILKFTLEFVSGPSAAYCFGFFLHLFPFLRNQ